jgi:prepilin-type processing-associated H-X9-DG protein/prepilin-type N-terminal cleavage/methylation domain-containing protein
MRSDARSRGGVGFTLVELLVVLGIITVLVSILFPVLSRVRQHAQAVRCAANLHSIGQALTMYTQQYGFYPGQACQDPAGEAAIWPVRLRPFMGEGKQSFYCPSQDERCRWTEDGPTPLRRATAFHARFGYVVGEPLIDSSAYFSYAYNGHGGSGDVEKGLGLYISAGPTPVVAQLGYVELRASRVRYAAEMIAIADSTADGVGDYAMYPNKSQYPSVWPGKVHRDGANVLFCDGHVQWYRQSDLLVDTPSTPARIVRMWNCDHRSGRDP